MQSKKFMSPELKKAIIKYVPDYFSWDKKRQEQYRVDTPEATFYSRLHLAHHPSMP